MWFSEGVEETKKRNEAKMYTIIREEGEEEFNLYFNGAWVCGYSTYDDAKDAIARLKAQEQYDAEEEGQLCDCSSPSKTPSSNWESIYWAD